MTTFQSNTWLTGRFTSKPWLNKKTDFTWEAWMLGNLTRLQLETLRGRKCHVSLFTWDNNSSMLEGKWLRLGPWKPQPRPPTSILALHRLRGLLPAWGFSPHESLRQPNSNSAHSSSRRERSHIVQWTQKEPPPHCDCMQRQRDWEQFPSRQVWIWTVTTWARWHVTGEVLTWRN